MSEGCGAGRKAWVLGGGRLAERAGRWILQDGLGRQQYRRGKEVVVKTGDAPQASVGISWRDAADELICLMVIRWERRRKQLKAERRERKKTPKEKTKEDPKRRPQM